MQTLPEAWKINIQSFAVDTLAVPMGVFTIAGDLIWANRGMQTLLGMNEDAVDPISWLSNPTFETLVQKADKEGLIFKGQLTAGDGEYVNRSVQASVYYQQGQLLICARYDVEQLGKLNQKMAEVNRHANNLQRQLMKQKNNLERTLQDLSKSEARYRRLFESAILGIFQSSSEGQLLEANPKFATIFGYDTPAAMLTGSINIGRDLYADPVKFQQIVDDIVEDKRSVVVENSYVRKDGSTFIGHLHKWPVIDDRGRLRHMEGFIEDIDAQRRLEAQVLQARKMEAVGILAGGIAHEFNNALSGMVGYLGLLEMLPNATPEVGKYCSAMMDLSERMTQLAKKLLAYAKGGKYWPKIQHLSPLIKMTVGQSKKLTPGDTVFNLDIDPDCSRVTIDETQIRMALSILIENAVEALELKNGGLIHIQLRDRTIDTADANRYAAIKPGHYAYIKVEDNGAGMSKTVAGHAFEPFYSTKFQGRGMGLAAAYGIIKNHNGWIYIESHEGKGTLAEIFLPSIEEEKNPP